jgi:hypothetical protein
MDKIKYEGVLYEIDELETAKGQVHAEVIWDDPNEILTPQEAQNRYDYQGSMYRISFVCDTLIPFLTEGAKRYNIYLNGVYYPQCFLDAKHEQDAPYAYRLMYRLRPGEIIYGTLLT